MQGLRHSGWAGLFKRHGALILILVCWAAQALGFWIANALPRAEASAGYPDESWDSRLTRMRGLSITIEARRQKHEAKLQAIGEDVSSKKHDGTRKTSKERERQ